MDVEIIEVTESVLKDAEKIEAPPCEEVVLAAAETATVVDTNLPQVNSPVNKRKLESDDEEMTSSDENKTSSKQTKSPSQSEEEKKIKKLRTQTFKNAVQLLNEIQQIKPLIFDFDAPPIGTPKPLFHCRVKFSLNSNETSFEATANSKKLAKTLVSIKAIDYLTNTARIFQSPTLVDYYRASIAIELKSLNLNLEEILDPSKNEPQPAVVPNTEQMEGLTLINSPQPLSPPNHSAYYLLKNDQKTSEMIRCQNPITILNYLIPNELKTGFLYGDESMMDNGNCNISEDPMNTTPQVEIDSSKSFKVVFKVRKDLQSSRFTKNAATIETRESIFVKETDEEFLFTGYGPSKKKAKYKAALLALDCLFNIKITSIASDGSFFALFTKFFKFFFLIRKFFRIFFYCSIVTNKIFKFQLKIKVSQ